jgi:hypothetical protein
MLLILGTHFAIQAKVLPEQRSRLCVLCNLRL